MPDKVALDAEYQFAKDMQLGMLGSGELVLSSPAARVALPANWLPCLTPFAVGRRLADAYTQFGKDLGIASVEEYSEMLAPLFKRGLLVPVPVEDLSQPFLLDHMAGDLRNEGAWTDIGKQLQSDHCVIVRDAFTTEFANATHALLDRHADWQHVEGHRAPHFGYEYYNSGEGGPLVAECERIFDSARTKSFMERVSGRSCGGAASISASYFMPGSYQLPHRDANDDRSVAFVWHLARDWNPSWGGAFYWIPTATYVTASFNTLILFNVTKTSNHFVTTVNQRSQSKRLAVNGWWNDAVKTVDGKWKGEEYPKLSNRITSL